MTQIDSDTICAIATSPGRSGVGIVRVSGPAALDIAKEILGLTPKNRYAHYSDFCAGDGELLDQGIALFFAQPHSFTGEDVLELQGHGGIHVLNSLRQRVLELGARLARPGEFSERAFLNGKIDLIQAEAIADLVDASSAQASKSALRTLRGDFSKQIHEIVHELTVTRVNVEAAIDFSDEELDILSDTRVSQSIETIIAELDKVFATAKQGVMLKEGLSVVIAGKPNAGKSSLLNALAGYDSAIVTNIPGTTRDLLSEQISVDGLPLNIVDTAGLRSSEDIVEQEGVKRAKGAIEQADKILLVVDIANYPGGEVREQDVEILLNDLGLLNDQSGLDNSTLDRLTLVMNKIDLLEGYMPSLSFVVCRNRNINIVALSASGGAGIELLREHLKTTAGYDSTGEDVFVARQRHLLALESARNLVSSAMENISSGSAFELVAEDLRVAQIELGKITGEFTSDDLLGEIFSNFCVGK